MKNQNDYYDNKNIRTFQTFELTFVWFISLIILTLLVNTFFPIMCWCDLILVWIIYYIRKYFKTDPKHQITLALDSYGSIQIFNYQNKFIALLYNDKTIEYQCPISYFQRLKVENISDYFAKYYNKLKDTDANK